MPNSASAASISTKQLRANRRNAKRSTGPRTEAGKARAAMNARVHGIFARDLLMPGEDAAELEAFIALLLEGLEPRDFLERSIAMQYVEAKWRIRRVRRAERQTHEGTALGLLNFDGGPYPELRRQLEALPRLGNWIDQNEQTRRGMSGQEWGAAQDQRLRERMAAVSVGHTLAHSTYGDGQGMYERLARYEHGLELGADRALRQLHRLRKERGPDWAPPEELEDVAEESEARDDEAPAQNEAISAATDASPDAAEPCEQRSCDIEPVAPTKLPSSRGLGVPPERFDGGAPENSSGETPRPRET